MSYNRPREGVKQAQFDARGRVIGRTASRVVTEQGTLRLQYVSFLSITDMPVDAEGDRLNIVVRR